MAQLWRCAICGNEHRPALAALEVFCPRPHRVDGRTRSGLRKMELVEGELPRQRQSRKTTELNRKKTNHDHPSPRSS